MTDAVGFVRERFGDRASVPERLGAGGWSTAYAMNLDGRAVVLRLSQHGEDFAKDAAMGLLQPAGLPVPAVVEHGAVDDGFYAISERLFGKPLETLTGSEMSAALPNLKVLLAAISAVDVDAIPGPPGAWPRSDLLSWPEGLLHIDSERPRLGGWREKLAASPVGTVSFDQGMSALRDLIGMVPDVRALIHNDLLAGNVLVKNAAITGIFDWGNAMVGDPLYEIAILRFWWPWFPEWSAIDIAHELTGPADEELVRIYELHIGLDHLQYNAWVGETKNLIRTDEQVRALLG